MPFIKLNNQQIILIVGSNGYSKKSGKRPLGAIIPFIAGVGLTLLLRRALDSGTSSPTKPSKSARREN